MANKSANIMRADMRTIKSSDQERIWQIYRERQGAIKAHQKGINRGIKAWQYYFALEGTQWPDKELAQLQDEDRLPYQFDVLSPKVDTMAGAIITDLQEPTWIPVEGEKTTTTEAVTDSYFGDKELTNWDAAILQTIIGGLVHGSWVEMIETYDHNPAGNIGLEYIRDGSIVTDPYWKSNDDRQLTKAWKSQYFTAEGLKYKYNKSTDKIKAAIEQTKRFGHISPPPNGAELRRQYAQKVGDEYEVIEEMWLEIIKTKRLVGRREGEFQTIPFPVTEDREFLELFAQRNNIDWETVKPEPYEDKIYHTTAIVPSLDPYLILNDEKPRVQVKRLPIFHFTTKRHDGKDKGLVESIMDIQTTLNKRINLESELAAKANGGATLYNENLFDSSEQKWREFKRIKNKPGSAMQVPLDEVNKIKEEITPNQYPSQVMTQIELMYNTLLPAVSNVSDAWSAESAANDSGILFERKVQMNKIATLVLDKGVKQLINNLGEAYYYQWQITYAKIPREVKKRDGKGKIILNETLPDGSIRNAVEYTPRCRVVVSESLNSPTQQMRKRTMVGETMKLVNPETNPLSYQELMIMMVENLDMPDERKAQIIESLELEGAVARTTLINSVSQNIAGITGARVQTAQGQMMLDKMGQQPAEPVQEQITSPEEQVDQITPPAPQQQPEQIQSPTEEVPV